MWHWCLTPLANVLIYLGTRPEDGGDGRWEGAGYVEGKDGGGGGVEGTGREGIVNTASISYFSAVVLV